MFNKKEENWRIGQIGESIATKFLESKGFSVVDRNVRYTFGEVDIVAKRAQIVHFVEVKSIREANVSRETSTGGGYRPEELVHPAKLAKIARVANVYMDRFSANTEYQIDVIAVFIDEERRVGRCRMTENVN